jgi:adenylate cyclase
MAGRPESVLDDLCRRLTEADVPVVRVAVFVDTLHPLLFGHTFIWTRERGTETAEATLVERAGDGFSRSPPLRVIANGETIRRRLLDPACPRDFAILTDLVADGCTDYLIQPLVFSDGRNKAVSWATRHPAGFAPEHLAVLEAVSRPLARVVEIDTMRRVATMVLDTYVGHRSGERILHGSIHCGDIERIEAVVMLLDLRDFTSFANAHTAEEAIARVNAFFACCVPAIAAIDGEVLKFTGDGLIAIVPLEGRTREAACAAALAAAEAIAGAVDDREALRARPLAYGVALHLGELLYGNIGAGQRLDFTAMGPVVNKAARLEKLAGQLGRPLVTSADFARHAGRALVPLGRWPLKGFPEPEAVFGLPDGKVGGGRDRS